MKTLSTEQQVELQKLIEEVTHLYQGLMTTPTDLELKAQLNYWAIELKPKRVRKKVLTPKEAAGFSAEHII